MYIKSIELRNFRNYKFLNTEFDPRVNLIIGPNAQGKTNLIEAVYLCSIGRSFRSSRDREMIRFGEKFAYIKAECVKELTDTKVEININKQSKKSIQKDGNTVRKMSQLLDNIIIVVFSPEDLKLVKDEPEKRRRFIDRELAQIKPAYYSALADYKKVLLQRNACLKEEKVKENMLDLWDAQLIRYGTLVMAMRNDFIRQMSIYSGDIHSRITNAKEKLIIQYHPNIPFAEERGEQKKKFSDAVRSSRDTDVRLRTTFRGPHKDDMDFFVNGIDLRSFGSQGQQRTAALSLKLAVLDFIREETGEEGILLLDDVMSELDKDRRRYLIGALSKNQIFITATDVDEEIRKHYPEAKIIEIRNGKIMN